MGYRVASSHLRSIPELAYLVYSVRWKRGSDLISDEENVPYSPKRGSDLVNGGLTWSYPRNDQYRARKQ